jgi:hypothetical protein
MDPNHLSKSFLAFDKWIHDHTLLIKSLRIIFDFLGLFLAVSVYISLSTIHLPLVLTGIFIVLISEVIFQLLNFFGFLAIDPNKHAFLETTYLENRIYYEGNIPILEIKETDSYKIGYAHGLLMAPYIFKMLSRTRLCAHIFGVLHFKQIKKSLPEIKKNIPSEYLTELEGLIQGMNDWDSLNSWIYSSRITLDEVLMFQLVPDMAHLTLSNLPVVGCTVLVDRDPKDHSISIGRHLDWPSFGTYGGHTLLIRRKKSVSIGVPGLIGDLTVINKDLFLCLNVCSPRVRVDRIETDKIPSTFLLRYLAENFSSVSDLKKAAQNSDLPISLVPFHANAADKQNAITLHFRQKSESELGTVIRTMSENRTLEPFATFNNHHPTETDETHLLFFAEERALAAKEQFAKYAKSTPLERLTHSLEELPINNHFTIHHVIYNTFSQDLYLSFDNSFAASKPHQHLSLRPFFS